MKTNKVVIIGAGRNQAPLIQKAHENGLETHVFSWQSGEEGEYIADYFYPISITNKNYILQEAKRLHPLAIVSCSSDLAAITVENIASQLGLNANSKETVELCTNKLSFRHLLQQNHILQPRFYEVVDALPNMSEITFPAIVKPTDRSGGKGVRFVTNTMELMESVNQARDLSFEKKCLIEEYIDGTVLSVETISEHGSHTILALTETIEKLDKNQFVEVSHQQPANLSSDLKDQIYSLSVQLLDLLQVSDSACHLEFFLRDNQLYVNEVSCCMTGDFVGSSLVYHSTGCDYLQMVLDVALGKSITPVLANKGQYQILYIHDFTDYMRFEAYQKEHGDLVVESKLFCPKEAIPREPSNHSYGYYIKKI